MRKRGATVLVLGALMLLGALAPPAGAQTRAVRFDGRVQWIAGQTMTVQLDTGGSVSVDLVDVRQEEYAGLSPNARVTVVGVMTDGSRRVKGTWVLRGSAPEAP